VIVLRIPALAAAIAVILGSGASAAAARPAELSAAALYLPPRSVGESARYAVTFRSEYGAGPVEEHGAIVIRRASPTRVAMTGFNVIDQGETAEPRTAPPVTLSGHAREDGSIGAYTTTTRISDMVLDYDSLITLLPRNVRALGAGARWTGVTRCWLSHTRDTAIPVTVTVAERRGDLVILRARGRTRIPFTVEGSRVDADAAVVVEMRFTGARLTRARLDAAETYRRAGLPAGGSTYTWTLERIS